MAALRLWLRLRPALFAGKALRRRALSRTG